jgi:hypothetical protein
MAAASSQPFGNLLANWSSAFKTPLDPMQTLPVKPEATPGVAGGYMSPEFQAGIDTISRIPNELAQSLAMTQLFGNEQRRQSDKEMLDNYPRLMEMISGIQRKNREEVGEIALREKIAGGFVDMVSGFPAKLTAHRNMVAPMNQLMRETRRSPINYGAVPIQRLF